MTQPLPFNKVKLQWLALLSQDNALSSTAIVIALYIITVHFNQIKGKAWPSYATIAKATGKTVKTVQRAIHELDGRWLNVKRGNGLGHSSEFSPNEISIQAATAMCKKRDNVVSLHPVEGGHKHPQRETFLSEKGGQKCPPNPETESRNEIRARLFVEFDSAQALSWNEWLSIYDMECLETLFPTVIQYSRSGCYMPSRYPPTCPDEIKVILQYLQSVCTRMEFTSTN
ncbi:MAG: helix-turn-helix domain-containing protein [Colwellia sp.]|nr:helix-turn-helix domain-containing protein [Colwellia sp.]